MTVTYKSKYNFNAEWAANVTLEKFKEEFANLPEPLTDAELKEAHALCKKAVNPGAKETT